MKDSVMWRVSLLMLRYFDYIGFLNTRCKGDVIDSGMYGSVHNVTMLGPLVGKLGKDEIVANTTSTGWSDGYLTAQKHILFILLISSL